jgi:hypothetical protein
MLHGKTPNTQTTAYPGDRTDARLGSQQVQVHLLLAMQRPTPQLLVLAASIEAQLARGAR